MSTSATATWASDTTTILNLSDTVLRPVLPPLDKPFGEYLCAADWKLVDKPLKREKLEADKRYRAYDIDWRQYDGLAGCKTQAIERAL